MKKVLSLITFVTLAVLMAGCGSKNTPTAVVEKSMQCLMENDYEGYVELIITDGSKISEEEKAKYDEAKQGMVSLIERKASKAIEQKGGIKGYEIISEQIDETGEKGAVKVKIIYGDGSEEEKDVTVRKHETGQWLLDLSK